MPEQPKLPEVPTTKDELLIAALRHANVVSMVFNEATAALFEITDFEEVPGDPRLDKLHDILRKKHGEASGLHLFIAADNLRLDLPPDLRDEGEPDEE